MYLSIFFYVLSYITTALCFNTIIYRTATEAGMNAHWKKMHSSSLPLDFGCDLPKNEFAAAISGHKRLQIKYICAYCQTEGQVIFSFFIFIYF